MAAAAPAHASGWLYGPARDLLLGGGLVYVPIFLLLLGLGETFREIVPPALMPLVILAFGTPHLGATLVRVYDRAEDRRAYRLFAIHLTLLLLLFFAAGLYVTLVGSLLITFYLTIVPWHFTGQNYGIALVFLRRRGVEVTPGVKRALYLSFVLSYALTFLALHGQILDDSYAPLSVEGTQYRFLSLGIPVAAQRVLLPLVAFGYVFGLAAATFGLRSRASWRDLAPAAALVATQALWYVTPVLAPMLLGPDRLGPLSPQELGYTFVWANMVHGVQYLWITSYYVRRQNPTTGHATFFVKALLAGSAIYGIPMLLLAPGVIGDLPYNSGLYLMVAGALNLHHVLLDGAIWKLRDGRIARILLQPSVLPSTPGPARARAPLTPRPWVWASGVLGVCLTVFGTLEGYFGFESARERGDLARLETSAWRMRWLGRASPDLYTSLGALRAEHGDVAGAFDAFDSSLALLPNASAWINIGALRERRGDVADALAAYREAVEIDPEDPNALFYAGRAALKTGQLPEARRLLEDAARRAPERAEIRRTLQRALRSERRDRVVAHPG